MATRRKSATPRKRAAPAASAGRQDVPTRQFTVLAQDPAVVLADEPTAALDPALAEEVMTLLSELALEQGTTLLVVAKAEHLSKGANPRFVVTSLAATDYSARVLYEKLYCARGEMENHIKEQQLALFADRTSAATMRANQLRLYFSSLAYCLLHALRRLALAGTALANAQCDTIRLRQLKLGARVRVGGRKEWVSLSQSYPHAPLHAWRALRAPP